jgi:histidyl-tRNA synthetase
VPVEPRKLGTELRRAANSGVAVAVIIGPDDQERGQLTIRDLRTREQLSIATDQVSGAVARMLRR